MKKYLVSVTAVFLFAIMALCNAFYSRVNEINPMTGDIPTTAIIIIAVIAVIAVIVLAVMGKMNKRR